MIESLNTIALKPVPTCEFMALDVHLQRFLFPAQHTKCKHSLVKRHIKDTYISHSSEMAARAPELRRFFKEQKPKDMEEILTHCVFRGFFNRWDVLPQSVVEAIQKYCRKHNIWPVSHRASSQSPAIYKIQIVHYDKDDDGTVSMDCDMPTFSTDEEAEYCDYTCSYLQVKFSVNNDQKLVRHLHADGWIE